MRANESSEAREKRLSAKRQLYKKKIDIQTISELIDKFHNAVTVGPLYVCSCCEQLWYKHINVFPQLKDFDYNIQI